MANLYTKTGDKGQTSLVGGSRVSKSSLRVECYGTIDEANSMLGLAYAQTDREYIRTTVHRIQGRLFSLGAELASDEQGAAGLTGKISEEDVAFLEGVVDKCTETTGKQTHFVIPGVDPASAALHVAALAEHEPVREVLARYINRLSDAVYALARLQEDLTQEERLRAQVTALVRKQLSAPEGGLPPFSLASLQRMAQRAVEPGRTARGSGGVLRGGQRRQSGPAPENGGRAAGQRGRLGRKGLYRQRLPDADP